jgi:Fur family transcriptional regulator, zinc uptake regulator
LLQSVDLKTRKLTRNQLLVMTVLEDADKPLTAYRILEQLQYAPLQVYRVLEPLIKIGRVHRLESLNAFIACSHSLCGHSRPHITTFQIYQECGHVTEFHDRKVEHVLLRHTRESGFDIRHSTI